MERLKTKIDLPCILQLQDDTDRDRFFVGFSPLGRPEFDVNKANAKVIHLKQDLRAYRKFIPIMIKSFKMYDKYQLSPIQVQTLHATSL